MIIVIVVIVSAGTAASPRPRPEQKQGYYMIYYYSIVYAIVLCYVKVFFDVIVYSIHCVINEFPPRCNHVFFNHANSSFNYQSTFLIYKYVCIYTYVCT